MGRQQLSRPLEFWNPLLVIGSVRKRLRMIPEEVPLSIYPHIKADENNRLLPSSKKPREVNPLKPAIASVVDSRIIE